MELRLRKNAGEQELSKSKPADIDSVISAYANLKNLLEKSRSREKRLIQTLNKHGIEHNLDIEAGVGTSSSASYDPELNGADDSKLSFLASLKDRGSWLIGLLIFQSCSSFILSSNTTLLNKHPSIVFFLTMLVGSGGNAGNQAAVRVIRGLACGTLHNTNIKPFLYREFWMAVSLSALLGFIGMLRAVLSFETTTSEAIAITTALTLIVFISIILGALLPLLLNYFRIDPAHASTSIQVIMDISGVLITCSVASTILASFDDIVLNSDSK
jgi:Mg/Co/Ni transporter MgtE